MPQLASKVKDHFLNPRNVGKIEGATVMGVSGNPATGSGIRLFLKLSTSGAIERMTYQIFNNAPAIAPASAFTELATGKTTSEAQGIDRAAIAAYLECDDALAKNLRFDIVDAFHNALAVLHGEAEPAQAGEVVRKPEEPTAAKPAAPERPKLILMQLIQDVLDSEIRPAVAMDGGDVELVDVEGRRVMLRLHGHCVGCHSSNTTMRFFIEDRLRELVDPGIEVVDVTEFEGPTHAPPQRAPY